MQLDLFPKLLSELKFPWSLNFNWGVYMVRYFKADQHITGFQELVQHKFFQNVIFLQLCRQPYIASKLLVA